MVKNFLYKLPGLSQVTPILTVLMEVIWSYAWFLWLSAWPNLGWSKLPLNLVSCVILGVFIEFLASLAEHRKWSLKRSRLAVTGAGLLLIIILLRINNGGGYNLWEPGWIYFASRNISALVTGLIFGLFLTWRGISASRPDQLFEDIYRKFVTGLIFIILLLVAWGLLSSQVSESWTTGGIYVIAYFGVGLLTLAITNLNMLRQELLQHQELARGFVRRWLSMLVILILAIIGVSVVIASMFSNRVAQALLNMLNVIGDWFIIALMYILFPLGILLQGLFVILRFIVNLLRGEVQPLEILEFAFGEMEEAVETQASLSIPEPLLLIIKWGGLALLIGLIAYFVSRSLIRYGRSKADDEIEEVSETVWSWAIFKTDLRTFLKWLFSWMRRRKPQKPEDFSMPLDTALADSDKLNTTRDIYKALLIKGRLAGYPRAKTETPYEYQVKLESHLESLSGEINPITEAYISEKYGQDVQGPEKVAWLNCLWKRLRSRLINPEPGEDHIIRD